VDRQSVELRSSNLSLLGQMAERLRIEDELRDSQARYQELFENANDIVYTHDLTGRFLSINKAGERITGYHRDELLGQGIDCLLPPEHLERARDMIRRKVQGHVPTVYELEILRKDGERVPLEVSTRIICQEGQPIAVQGIARDISERKKAEEQRRALEAKIQYAQRLESMTNLAEGIAHDFNNLLTRIVANVGVAALDLPEESAVHASLKRIEIAAEHASELVDQMFAYAGKGHRRIETLHLAAVVESMSSLLESVVAKGTTLIYDLGTETEAVAADTTQLRQIVMNLVLNASDALPDEGGSIEIRTGVLTLAEGEMENWPGPRGIAGGPLEPGRYVWLEIADSGRGIEPADLTRVFDPFFTTKASGRGLGLAAVLGIVRAHHGGIRISSAPGKGTTFHVLLPVHEEQSLDGHAEITHRAVPVSS
jgi:PAS domain S-box-containing protein